MRMKTITCGILLFILLGVSGVLGVECGSTPVEDCTLEADTTYTFDGGTWYLNDTNGNGVIIGNGADIIVNCDGGSFVGNWTSGGRAWVLGQNNNITLNNCNFYNYTGDYYIDRNNTISNSDFLFNGNFNIRGSGVNGYATLKLINSTIIYNSTANDKLFWTYGNSTFYSLNSTIKHIDGGKTIKFQAKDNNNITLIDSSFSDFGRALNDFNEGISILNSRAILIRNNNFSNGYTAIQITNSTDNILIKDNIINKFKYDGIRLNSVNGSIIENNTLKDICYNNEVYAIHLTDGSNNRFLDNYIDGDATSGSKNCRDGIGLLNINWILSTNNSILNNRIYNVTTECIYNYGNITNTNISNNNLYNCSNPTSATGAVGGILIESDVPANSWRTPNGMFIFNNTIEFGAFGIVIDTSDNNIINNNNISDVNNAGIYFEGDTHDNRASDNILGNSNFGIQLDEINSKQNSNNSFYRNIISGMLERGISIRNSTSLNFYNTSITSSVKSDWEMGNYFSNSGLGSMTNYDSVIKLRFTGNINNISIDDFNGWNFNLFNVTDGLGNLTSNYMLFTNSNDTFDSIINLYSLSDSLIYFSNGSVACSTISTCDDNINVTLSPNNYTYVLDDFNLTEGVSRTNSPIWFSSTSNAQKSIASNLTDTIDTTVIFNVLNCDTVGTITYTSETGTFSRVYTSDEYTCTDNIISLDIVGIETASSSNQLDIEYNAAELAACSNMLTVFLTYPLLIGLVGTIIFLGLVITIITGFATFKGEIKKTLIISAVITLVALAVLVIIGIVAIEVMCNTF